MQKSEERKKGGQGRNAEVETKAHFYQGKCQKKRDGPYVESINLDIAWTEWKRLSDLCCHMCYCKENKRQKKNKQKKTDILSFK